MVRAQRIQSASAQGGGVMGYIYAEWEKTADKDELTCPSCDNPLQFYDVFTHEEDGRWNFECPHCLEPFHMKSKGEMP